MGVLTQTVSTLSDVIRMATDLLSEVGDGTTIQVGKKYLSDFGTGMPPKILFVQHPKGKVTKAPKLNAGYLAGILYGCTVYVRGAENGTDTGQFDNAVILAKKVMNLVKGCDPGHVVLANDLKDDSPLPDDAYGADLVFGFSYLGPVEEDKTIRRAPRVAQPIPDPDRPQGGNGKNYVSTYTAEAPTRP